MWKCTKRNATAVAANELAWYRFHAGVTTRRLGFVGLGSRGSKPLATLNCRYARGKFVGAKNHRRVVGLCAWDGHTSGSRFRTCSGGGSAKDRISERSKFWHSLSRELGCRPVFGERRSRRWHPRLAPKILPQRQPCPVISLDDISSGSDPVKVSLPQSVGLWGVAGCGNWRTRSGAPFGVRRPDGGELRGDRINGIPERRARKPERGSEESRRMPFTRNGTPTPN
jgi:hypothetical protein